MLSPEVYARDRGIVINFITKHYTERVRKQHFIVPPCIINIALDYKF